jgi:hypothetical protein
VSRSGVNPFPWNPEKSIAYQFLYLYSIGMGSIFNDQNSFPSAGRINGYINEIWADIHDLLNQVLVFGHCLFHAREGWKFSTTHEIRMIVIERASDPPSQDMVGGLYPQKCSKDEYSHYNE